MLKSPQTLLIIEDEEAMGEGLKFNFDLEGYNVVWCKDGLSGLQFVKENQSEVLLILLDLMLPEMNGEVVLQRVREFADQIPIIVLSAKSGENDKVSAFEFGADDYVTKPFSLNELIARVKGLVKRRIGKASQNSVKELKIGHATIQTATLIVHFADGTTGRVSPTEALLVEAFLENANKILTRHELLEKVWNYDSKMETRTVDVFVSKIRRFSEHNPGKPEFLISVRGAGYAYVTDPVLKQQLLGSK